MMLKYECVEMYPIHFQAAGQFRQALYLSGSKERSNPTRSCFWICWCITEIGSILWIGRTSTLVGC